MQQVVGHVCIHRGQRVVEEIELLFLGRGGDTMAPRPRWSGQNPDLSWDTILRQSEKTVERNSAGYPRAVEKQVGLPFSQARPVSSFAGSQCFESYHIF